MSTVSADPWEAILNEKSGPADPWESILAEPSGEPTPIPEAPRDPYSDNYRDDGSTGNIPEPGSAVDPLAKLDPVYRRKLDIEQAQRDQLNTGPFPDTGPPVETGTIGEVPPRSEFGAGFKQAIAGAIPPGLDIPAAQRFKQGQDMQKPAEGAAGFAGGVVGGAVALPTMVVPRNPGDVAALLAGGPIGKAAEPVVAKIGAIAGEKVAKIVAHQISLGGISGGMEAAHVAGAIPPEQWATDPAGAIQLIAEAAGKGAASGVALGTLTGAAHAAMPGRKPIPAARERTPQEPSSERPLTTEPPRVQENVPPVEAPPLREEGPSQGKDPWVEILEEARPVQPVQGEVLAEANKAAPVEPKAVEPPVAEPVSERALTKEPPRAEVPARDDATRSNTIAQDATGSSKADPLTMKPADLRRELTEGGVEFDPKASKRELASGVEQLRALRGQSPPTVAESKSSGPSPSETKSAALAATEGGSGPVVPESPSPKPRGSARATPGEKSAFAPQDKPARSSPDVVPSPDSTHPIDRAINTAAAGKGAVSLKRIVADTGEPAPRVVERMAAMVADGKLDINRLAATARASVERYAKPEAEQPPKKFTADDWMKQDKAVREKRAEDAAFVVALRDREYISPRRTDASGDTKVVEFGKPRDFRLPNTDHTKDVDPAIHGAEVTRLMEQGQKPSDYVATVAPEHHIRNKSARDGIGNLKAFMREVPEFNLDPTFTVVADGARESIRSVDAKGKMTYTDGPPALRLKFKDGGTYIWEPDAIGIVLPEGVKAGEKIRIDPEAVRKMKVDEGWLVSAPGTREADLSKVSTYGTPEKKPRPRKGENIIIPKVVEEAAGLASRGAHGAKNIAEGAVASLRRLSDTASGYMERLGPAGKKLAGEVRDIDRTGHKESATDRLALRDVLAGMDRKARETVAKAINGRIGELHQPASLRAKAAQVREILDRAMKAANAAGLKRTVAGHEVDIKGSGKAFPQVPNEAGRIVLDEAETKGLSSPRVQRTIEKIHRARRERAGLDPETPPTPDETNHILASLKKLRDQQKRGVNPYFERTRIELPEDLVEWDPARVLPHLLDRNWMLVQAVEKWGPDFKGRDAGLQTIAYEHGQHHATTIDNYLKASFGLTGQVDPAIDKAIRAASNYESLSKMGFSPLSVFRNVGGRFSNLFGYDPSIQLKALKDLPPFVGGLFRESRKIGEAMEKTGAVRATSTLADIEVGAPGHGITNKALGLFKVAERGNQVHTSYIAGLQLAADIDRLAKAQPRGPLGKIMESLVSLTGLRDTDAGVARRVERAGIDGDQLADIMADPKHRLTPEQVERAAYLAVNDTQFALSLATSPVWWANSPVMRLMAKFKPWGVRQVQLIYNQVAKEAIKGNGAPLARFLVAMTVTGEAYYAARDLLTGSDKSITSAALGGEGDPKEYVERVGSAFLAGGGLGFIADMTYGVSEWIGGPAVGTGKNLAEVATSIAQRPTLIQSQAAVRKFFRDEFAVSRQALPIIDRIDKWAFNEGNVAVEYGRLRSKAFGFKADKKDESIVKRALGAESFAGGKNSVPYDYAARNITVNDVDDAADYLASVLEDAPDRKAAIQGIRASLRSHSPLGPVAEKDRAAFMQSLTAEERQKALALNAEWTQRANRALAQAMQKVAASARARSAGGSQ